MPVCPVCQGENPDAARFCVECGVAFGSSVRDTLNDDPLIGRVLLDRFRVVRLLGSGGASRVYLAQQFIGPAVRNAALKVLTPGTLPELDFGKLVKRFYRECETIVALSHPNIIRVYDFGQLEDGTLFIAMEYIEGAVTLADALPLPLERVQVIVTQICDALNEAHVHGIIHRDLKPDNVLLSRREGRDDLAKVLDFGIAKRVESTQAGPALTESGVVLGTPPYMSPEQFGGGPIDGRSDIYSLGVMTYELLTGELPFHAESTWEWAARHLAAEPIALESTERGKALPKGVRAAIMHALAKDPRDRPATALDFASRISAALPKTAPLDEVFPFAPTEQPTAMMSPSPSSFPPQNLPATVLMEEHRERPRRARWYALAASGLVAAGGITAIALYTTGWFDGAARGTPPALPSPAPTETPSPAAQTPSVDPRASDGRWFESVHHVDNASNAQFVLGKADERYAQIGGGGFITLELTQKMEFIAGGNGSPDLVVHVAPQNRASYSVEVAIDHDHFTSVVGSTRRSVAIDLDDRAVQRARYVRIKNRTRGGILKIDAIEATSVGPTRR